VSALVAHAYSYSGDRNGSLKSAPDNSCPDSILRKPNTKKGLVEWLKVWAPSSNPSTAKKKIVIK
jgi:hypothetical protein